MWRGKGSPALHNPRRLWKFAWEGIQAPQTLEEMRATMKIIASKGGHHSRGDNRSVRERRKEYTETMKAKIRKEKQNATRI